MKSNLLSQMPPTSADSCVHIFNLSDALAEFRAQLERQAGVPLDQVEVSAAFVLDDLCAFLGFDQPLRSKILGQNAAIFVDVFLSGRQVCIQSNESNA